MNNITTKIAAKDLKRILEEHLRQNLATNKRANVREISPAPESSFEPGQPTNGVIVTFDVIDV